MKMPSVKVLAIGAVSLVFGLPGVLFAALLLCFAQLRKAGLKMPSIKALIISGASLIAGPPAILVLALLLCFLEPTPIYRAGLMEGFAIIGGIVIVITIAIGVLLLLTAAGLAISRRLKARDGKAEEI